MGPVGELGDCVGGEEADNRDKWLEVTHVDVDEKSGTT